MPAAADALVGRSLGVSERHWRFAGRVGADHLDLPWRHHRGGELVCPWCVHSVHAVPAGIGAALVAVAWTGLAGADAAQCLGCPLHVRGVVGDHCEQVHGRRLDGGDCSAPGGVGSRLDSQALSGGAAFNRA